MSHVKAFGKGFIKGIVIGGFLAGGAGLVLLGIGELITAKA